MRSKNRFAAQCQIFSKKNGRSDTSTNVSFVAPNQSFFVGWTLFPSPGYLESLWYYFLMKTTTYRLFESRLAGSSHSAVSVLPKLMQKAIRPWASMLILSKALTFIVSTATNINSSSRTNTIHSIAVMKCQISIISHSVDRKTEAAPYGSSLR